MRSLLKETEELVPDPQVCREFGITLMTLWRWDHDEELKFPPAIQIRKKNYRSRRELEQFKQRLIKQPRG
jgi:predicted DNA-binding transcriptional regulator AlpA